MKKLSALVLAGSIAISSFAFATPYKLMVVNDSLASNVQLYSSTDQANTKPLPNTGTKTTQSTLDTTNQYQIRVPNKQIFGSLKQDNTYFTLQNTPAAAGPGIQNLKVTVEANGQTGSYQTVGSANPTGICSPDQSGVTCELGTSVPDQINITLSGGTKPTPVKNYVLPAYPSGNSEVKQWDANTQYGVYHPGNLHDRVSYQGAEWVACYWVPKGETPGSNPAWKEFNPATNVCNG